MLAVASLLGRDHHLTTPRHPERPARLDAADEALRAYVPSELRFDVSVDPAPMSVLERVHDVEYLQRASSASEAGVRFLDPDTPISSGSWDTALLAAGAGLTVVDAIDAGRAARGFVLCRPPGHHATATRSMGFCIVNNVAVTAASLAARGEKVAIVDWDVHHGNGTQDIFWNDPNVLFCSIHQAPPHYPGTGAVTETGGSRAPGATINVPVPPTATGDSFRAAIDTVIAPAFDEFNPTWLLISAGFDAHRDDPLADLRLTSTDYGDLTRSLLALVPNASGVIAFLEGGYDLAALNRSVGATAAALVGENVEPEERSTAGPGTEVSAAAWEQHRRAVRV
jgi:acetoin utilization deacetylase AcuC-like enzyme